jgi:mRNA degradation ribonuclease J1/J2
LSVFARFKHDLTDDPPRTEDDVVQSFVDHLTSADGLVLLSLYDRDVERAAEFAEATPRLPQGDPAVRRAV